MLIREQYNDTNHQFVVQICLSKDIYLLRTVELSKPIRNLVNEIGQKKNNQTLPLQVIDGFVFILNAWIDFRHLV